MDEKLEYVFSGGLDILRKENSRIGKRVYEGKCIGSHPVG